MSHYPTLLRAGVLMVLASASVAQEISDSPPLESSIGYSSVFDSYVPFDHVPDINWREANDKVGEIGGWRAYLKMVQEIQKLEAEAKAKEGDKQ